MTNIHVCGLTCPEYVGYQSWLNNRVPGTEWLGFDSARVTWGGLILGITGLLLLFLALSGIWLWWPGIRRWPWVCACACARAATRATSTCTRSPA